MICKCYLRDRTVTPVKHASNCARTQVPHSCYAVRASSDIEFATLGDIPARHSATVALESMQACTVHEVPHLGRFVSGGCDYEV
eukprot:scaffold5232_cov408-Prasinococcus_capsulatus_cf.AAC.3